MIAFIETYWAEILLSLLCAGALAACKALWGQVKKYRALLEEKDDEEIDAQIDEKLKPVIASIEELSKKMEEAQDKDECKFQLIITFYRYQLISLCDHYLHQGFILPDQYRELSELYRVYSKLGGNGQAEEMYHRVLDLADKPPKKPYEPMKISQEYQYK